jgi:hypothetical protein
MTIDRRALLLVVIAVAALLNACAERTPLATASPDRPPPVAQATGVTLECRVQVASRAMECATPSLGGRGDLLVGGQDRFVKIRSSNLLLTPFAPALRAGHGGRGDVLPPVYTLQLSADLTVQNLLSLPMGTTDGTTPDPSGLRIFFFSSPTVIGGSGEVIIFNPDGVADFTASGQPYFAYPGILAPGAVTAPKNWQFRMTAGVTEFSFLLAVAAPMPNEGGWITVSPAEQELNVHQGVQLHGTVHAATGFVVDSQKIVWSTANSAVATVDNLGVVVGVAPGTTIITGTSGARSGRTVVAVGTFDATAPTMTSFALSRDSVHDGDSVTVVVTLNDGGVGVDSFKVRLTSPGNFSRSDCAAYAPSTGTRASGDWQCSMRIPPGATPGLWNVEIAALTDFRGNLRTLNRFNPPVSADPSVQVTTVSTDNTPPFLNNFTYSATTVNAGETVEVTATMFDIGTGPSSWSASWFSQSTKVGLDCSVFGAVAAAGEVGLKCNLAIPPGTLPGEWNLSELTLTDGGGNRRLLTPDDVAGLHFPTSFTVVNPHPDVTPPVLASMAIDTPSGSPKDRLVIHSTLFDPGGSGLASLRIAARARQSQRRAACETVFPELVGPIGDDRPVVTADCTVIPPDGFASGEWFIDLLELRDHTGNVRSYNSSDLDAAHIPYVLRFGGP